MQGRGIEANRPNTIQRAKHRIEWRLNYEMLQADHSQRHIQATCPRIGPWVHHSRIAGYDGHRGNISRHGRSGRDLLCDELSAERGSCIGHRRIRAVRYDAIYQGNTIRLKFTQSTTSYQLSGAPTNTATFTNIGNSVPLLGTLGGTLHSSFIRAEW